MLGTEVPNDESAGASLSPLHMIDSPLRPTISLRATDSLGTLGPMPRTTKSPSRTASARTATARMTSREHKSGGKVLAKDLEPRKGSPAWRPAERTQFLIDTVGGVTKLARTLGVAASQPSRWRSGKEVPSPEIASKLLDLDHVVALAVQAWDPAVVMDWMTTSNGFLDGAQPIKVLLQRGSPEVIDALKATISGAYV